ncbi:MAG: hypothetical protein J3K34DRAFT_434758 [Monoraphidium minutum]|nr:MAG: hypothetical protein J3K34DRAFT_434758 [Monoraphidium minutum]
MAAYLKKYVDRVHDVPPQLQRLFKLIRDLDERVVALQAAVEDKCRASLASAAPSKKQRAKAEAALRDEVNADMQKILSLSEEKVRIAAQCYDFVDSHIRQLDEDLRAFDGELHSDRARLGLKDGETASKALGVEADYPANAPGAVRQKRKYTRRKGTGGGEQGGGPGSPVVAAAPDSLAAATALADSSEPRYCICNNVSYGEMIACDNPDCIVEWFHYDCVGISQQPKGKWYCPQCRAAGVGAQ